MALIQSSMMKRIIAVSGGSLKADANESFLIRDIFCVPSAGDTFLTLSVDQTVVGNVRVKGHSGNHAPYPADLQAMVYEEQLKGALKWLRSVGIPLEFPVAANQEFTVGRYAEAGDVVIVYDRYDAGDITAVMPNGTASAERTFLKYLTNAAEITVAGDTKLTKALGSAALPDFPIGETAPEGRTVELLAILASASAHGNDAGAANVGYTEWLKIIREAEVIGDPDRNGYRMLGDVAQVANATSYAPVSSVVGPCTDAQPQPGLFFEQPIVWTPGQGLEVYVTVTGAAAEGHPIDALDVCLVLRHRRGGGGAL